MAQRVQDKVAIITGAGSGIGAATALRYGSEGARIVCADIDGVAAEAIAQQIADQGGDAVAVAVDVSDQAQTERMADLALEHFGTIDVLYANAGIAGTGTAKDTTVEMWDRVIAVNLTGVWLSMRAVLPTMVEHGGGAIINQASIGGLIGVPGIFPYAAAKAGVIGMTRQAAVDFGPHDVRINAIAPGTAPTPLVTATYEARAGMTGGQGADAEEALARVANRYPIGRLGTVEDIANLALFLGSDEAAWITGSIYVIDGGYTAV
jgi:NAD(P)-dependent dehydrogenase (short-subunit alcohol dehydrogenase family)